MKRCKACGERKPLDSFHKSRKGIGGRVNRCKDCLAEAHRARHYGMAPGLFEQMLVDQEGKCLLCEQLMTRPCVDHDHETGEVRGLLCIPCNRTLGYLENEGWYTRAADYLGWA